MFWFVLPFSFLKSTGVGESENFFLCSINYLRVFGEHADSVLKVHKHEIIWNFFDLNQILICPS
jgi:hypothetical protein